MLVNSDVFRRLCLARDRLAEVAGVEAGAVSIADVAREAGISPFHFIRQFDRLFGVTPHQFRIGQRIDHARALLARGQLSVTDVCFEVGFSSLGSFSDLFSRRVGEAPSAYRRRVRASVQVPGMPLADLTPGCLTLMWRLPRTPPRNFREA